MKVVLQSDVAGLGKRGDQVQVAEGYARNFLIPRGLAKPATDGVIRAAEHLRQEQKERVDRQRATAQAQAARLEGKTITLRVRAGEGGKLFGSVTARDIADAIAEQHGIKIDRRRVMLDEPIKTTGVHAVRLHLYAGVDLTLQVQVVR